MTYSFPNLEPVCCSMSSSNCRFLTCIQISQEAGQVVWFSHLFKNLPQSVVIHTVKGFGIVSKAEVEVFLELLCFFNDPMDAGNLISGSSAFSKSIFNIWRFAADVLLKPGLENLSMTLLVCAAAAAAAESLQSCPTLCDPIDGSLLGSFVHGIFQVRIVERVAISISKFQKRQCQRMLKLLNNCTHLTC